MDVHWPDGLQHSYAAAVEELLRVFGEHDSLAVQQTIFAMGEAMLARDPALGEVKLTMRTNTGFRLTWNRSAAKIATRSL